MKLQDESVGQVKISDFGISGIVANEALSSLRVDPEAESAADSPSSPLHHTGHERIHAPEEVTLILGEGRSAPSGKHNLTHDDEVMGTPAFMAPELVRKGEVSLYATDIFAFGVVAFLLLTRRMPYERSALSALSKGLDWRVEQTSRACPALDSNLAEVLDACLDLDPKRRPTARAIDRILTAPRIRSPRIRSSFASS